MSPAAPFPPPFPPTLSEVDHCLLQDATAKLHSTLRLPSANPLVARWLFSNSNIPFHPDASLLPAEVFSDSLVIRIEHDVTAFTPSSFASFPAPFSPFPKPASRSAHLHLLLVPAAHTDDGLVLGYNVAAGLPMDDELYPFASVHPFTRRALLRGRFAFCPKQKHMVCVIHDLSPDLMGIIGLEWLENNRRDRFFFTVPNQQYDFHNLPTRVLALLNNSEFKIAGVQREWFARGSNDDSTNTATYGPPHVSDIILQPPTPTQGATDKSATAQTAEEFFSSFLEDDIQLVAGADEVPDVVPASDNSVWSDDFLDTNALHPSTTVDETKPTSPVAEPSSKAAKEAEDASAAPKPATAFHPSSVSPPSTGVVSTHVTGTKVKDDSFDLTSMFHSLLDLERSLEGRFFSPRVSRDIMNPATGEVVSRTTGEVRASLELASTKDARMLREIAAQSYYAITLAVTNDRMLTFPKRSAGALKDESCERVGEGELHEQGACGSGQSFLSKRPRLEWEEAMLVPKTMPVCGNCRSHGAEQVAPAEMSEESIREARKEAKRRKNRLSAARSNQRKKERIEAQKKELEGLKERVVRLKDAQMKLTTENITLRQQCSMQD